MAAQLISNSQHRNVAVWSIDGASVLESLEEPGDGIGVISKEIAENCWESLCVRVGHLVDAGPESRDDSTVTRGGPGCIVGDGMGYGHPEDRGVLRGTLLRIGECPTPHRVPVERLNQGVYDSLEICRCRQPR